MFAEKQGVSEKGVPWEVGGGNCQNAAFVLTKRARGRKLYIYKVQQHQMEQALIYHQFTNERNGFL